MYIITRKESEKYDLIFFYEDYEGNISNFHESNQMINDTLNKRIITAITLYYKTLEMIRFYNIGFHRPYTTFVCNFGRIARILFYIFM